MTSQELSQVQNALFDAMSTRKSVRSFLNNPVEEKTVRDILVAASRAPSGTNMQPWKTYVLTGQTKTRLCETVCNAFDANPKGVESEMRYYPEQWFEPYIARRRKVGFGLYGLLGIKKGDTEKMHAQHRRNFMFFDAPVGFIFTIDRELATGSWLDYGMFLQNIMLAARSFDLHTCAQAAWADFHPTIREQLSLPDNEIVVCGMSMGFANENAPENTLATERASLDENTCFLK